MGNKKKLVYVITKSSWGGAQKYILDLVAQLEDKYDISVVCGKNEFEGPNTFFDVLEKKNISVYVVSHMKKRISLISELQSAFVIYSHLKKIKPDVVHLNSPKAGGIGGVASRILGVRKIVYTAHGLNIHEERPRWQKTLIHVATNVILKLSHQIISISNLDNEVLKKTVRPSKLNLIYNGITPFTSFQNAREKLINKLPKSISQKINKDTIILGNIAELTKNKGITYLLETFKKIKINDWVYVHFGTGDLEKGLKQKVHEYGLDSQVYFMGFDSQAKRYLGAFDVLVFSSIKEGLPYVPLEAGYAGVCVVSTNVGGIPDIISSGENGILVNSKNSTELQVALEKIMQDKNTRNLYAQRLQKIVQKNFSVNKMAIETQRVYNI